MLRSLILALHLVAGPAMAQDLSGADAFAANCSRCHTDPAVLMQSTDLLADTDGATRLDTFLLQHKGARDAAVRASIVTYLTSLR
jgi:mono/diheme cytochrome c family protein